MRSAKPTIKEPIGKKASGLGKLIGLVHQNAASLVTTRTAHNGPDQVLPATEYLTSRRNLAVRLRKEETGLGAEDPVSVPSMLQDIAERYPEVLALKERSKVPGEWTTWSYRKLLDDVQTAARAFVELGLHRHHSVAILGDNSPEWVISNMAAIMGGGISCGVQTSMSHEDVAKIALDSKADIIVVDQEYQLKKVLLIQHKLPELRAIILIHGEPSISDKRRLHKTHKKHILTWVELIELGQAIPEGRLEERLRRVSINQCCTLTYTNQLTYTNGTNAAPSGLMYSHDNLTWSAKMVLGFIRAPGFNKNPGPGEEILMSYLPLSHISTQMVDVYYLMGVAGTLVFPGTNVLHDTENFFTSIKEVQPTILYGPPVIYERIYHRLIQLRRSASGVERFFLDWSNHTVSKNQGSTSPRTHNKMGDIQQKIAKNTICKKYKESLGLPAGTLYLCRGGTLQDRLLKHLAGTDIIIHSAYGQSEVTSFLASNSPKRFCKFSTVGKAVPGVKLKIEKAEGGCPGEETGEVQGYGRNIFMGYLNKENENTAKLTEEKWFKLGDQATIDNEGFLIIHGRKQDELVMSSGIVNPAQIEGNLRLELPCINSCIVVGHGTDRLGALLSLDTEVAENGQNSNKLTQQTIDWFRATRFDVTTINDVIENLETGLKHVFQAGIDRANQLVQSSCHMIVEWRVLPNSFSVSTGELGPTLHIRRGIILGRYSEHINQLLTQQDGRKHSFTDSLGGESATGGAGGMHDPYPHQLHQIIEEEERSNRNSVDKEVVPEDSNNNNNTKDQQPDKPGSNIPDKLAGSILDTRQPSETNLLKKPMEAVFTAPETDQPVSEENNLHQTSSDETTSVSRESSVSSKSASSGGIIAEQMEEKSALSANKIKVTRK